MAAAVAVLAVAGGVTAAVNLIEREDPPVTGASCGFQDEFDGDTLDPAWRQTRPDVEVVVADGAAEVTAPDGADLYETYLDAPMLLREVPGDFVATVDVTANPGQFYQGAGLVVWVDAEHYARVERSEGETDVIIFEYKDGGSHQQVHSTLIDDPAVVRTEAEQVVLEFTRTGTDLRARWHPADDPEWSDLGSITMYLPDTVEVGASVLNRAQRGAEPTTFSAWFNNFTLTC